MPLLQEGIENPMSELKMFAAKCAIVGATVIATSWVALFLYDLGIYEWVLF